MVNKVILVGNLGRDPEIRNLESGSMVGRFSVATNENYRDREGNWQTITEWHNVVVWRQLAERAERSLRKGMQVYIEGKLQTRKYTDRDNNERTTTEVVANTLRILEKRENTGGGTPGVTSGSSESLTGGGNFDKFVDKKTESGADDFKDSEEDDLPF